MFCLPMETVKEARQVNGLKQAGQRSTYAVTSPSAVALVANDFFNLDLRANDAGSEELFKSSIYVPSMGDKTP